MTDASRPKIIAPTKKLTPRINDNATPGKTACEMASPINDRERKMMKHPTAPETIPITRAVKTAFCKK